MPANKNKRKTETKPLVVEPPAADPPPSKPAPKRRKKAAETASSEVSSVAPSSVAPSSVAPSSVAPSSVAPSSVGVKKPRKARKQSMFNTRTPSSYVLFSMDHRKKVTEKSSALSLGEVSKQCSVAWKALSVEEKQPWMDQAAARKAERIKEVEEIKKGMPIKKKRAPSSYLLFAMAHRKVVLVTTPGLGIGDVSKKCGAAWKELSDTDKQQWKDQALTVKQAMEIN